MYPHFGTKAPQMDGYEMLVVLCQCGLLHDMQLSAPLVQL